MENSSSSSCNDNDSEIDDREFLDKQLDKKKQTRKKKNSLQTLNRLNKKKSITTEKFTIPLIVQQDILVFVIFKSKIFMFNKN